MNPRDDSHFDALPLAAVLRINAVCDAFEGEWKAGRQPSVENFLGDSSGAERASLREQLAALDAEYRSVAIEEFTRRLAMEQLTPTIPASHAETSQPFADRLIAAGHLTPYQARVLLSPSPHPLALNDYLILDRIATGGMGIVYRAIHRRMKREVALKALPDEHTHDANRVRRFQREVELAAKLVHPHIVTAYDAGESRGWAYLVSEYVDGTDLQQRVQKHGPLSLEEAVQAIRDAANGLAHAHESGVIHRDVKPSNLIRTSSGVVRVLDLGLARLTESVGSGTGSRMGVAIGTPDFMSPEQVTAPATVDARSDIYSLGCTLYFLLTGRPVYGGATLADRMSAHLDGNPPSLKSARSDVPDSLDDLFQRMVARDPDERPGSMQAVSNELGKSASGRRRYAALAVALLTLLIGTVAVIANFPRNASTTSRARPDVRTIPFPAAESQREWAESLGIPVEIEVIPGLKARLIPPGHFVLGLPPGTVEEWLRGQPEEYLRERVRGEQQRPATVPTPFYLGITEVSVSQYRQFVHAQSPPYLTIAERPDGVGYRLTTDRNWVVESGATWRTAGEQPLSDEHPVCNLGRDDCSDFCRWLTIQLDGRFVCRLPTETEWEFACRSGSAGLWSCGSNASDLGPLAWFAETVDATDACFRPVARKSANGLGLFDMHGNLEEWCSAVLPEQGFVLRGGNVRSSAMAICSVARDPSPPTAPRGGFRVVFELRSR